MTIYHTLMIGKHEDGYWSVRLPGHNGPVEFATFGSLLQWLVDGLQSEGGLKP